MVRQHEALAREKYLGDYPDEASRRENADRVNQLFQYAKSPSERELLLSFYEQETAKEYALKHSISEEAAKKRRKRLKEKLVRRFAEMSRG